MRSEEAEILKIRVPLDVEYIAAGHWGISGHSSERWSTLRHLRKRGSITIASGKGSEPWVQQSESEIVGHVRES